MYLKIGTIVKQVGLNGEVRIFSTTSLAKKRYKKGNTLYIKNGDSYIPVTVRTYRKLNGSFDVVSFDEYSNIDATSELIKKDVYGEKDLSILDKNQYFYHDLINCKIKDQNNNVVGLVISVEEFPAQITLKCKTTDGKEFFIPFIPQFITNIDINEKQIDVTLIEGML